MIAKRTIVVYLFFLLTIFPTQAQDKHKADSLKHVLQNKYLPDSLRAKNLNRLAYYHEYIDSALMFANESLQLSKRMNAPIAQAEALEEISHIQRRLGNNDLSLAATFKALKIFDSLGLTARTGASYNQLASNYITDDNPVAAIHYFKLAYDIYETSKHPKKQLYTLLNLGEAYRLAAYNDSAKITFNKVFQLNTTQKSVLVNGYALGNTGMLLTEEKEYASAKKHLEKSLKIMDSIGDSYSSCIYLLTLGKIYKNQNDTRKAEETFLKGYHIALTKGYKEQIRDASELLSYLYEARLEYRKALRFHQFFKNYQDSLVNKQNIQNIERLKSAHEIEKRESRIHLLSTINYNQKRTLVLLAFGIVTLLILLALLFRANKKIQKINHSLELQKNIIATSEHEKGILLQELNHRVKNNLQMIASLLSLQEQELTGHPAQDAITEGKNRVEALTLVHQKLYQEELNTVVPLKAYIIDLVEGLFYSYNAKFTPLFQLENVPINVDKAIPLALIINEIIINALKYAYEDIQKPELHLTMNVQGSVLYIDIMDNGNGFEMKQDTTADSFGIKLIYSLIQQIKGSIHKPTKLGHWQIQINDYDS